MRKDWTGQTFYRLTALKFSRRSSNSSLWFWRCDCGNMTEADPHKVKNGKTKSCGCYRVEWLTSKARSQLMKDVAAKRKGENRGNAAWQALGR